MESIYDTDLDDLEMFSEIMDCRMLLKTRADVKLSTAEDLLRFIVQYGDDVFPKSESWFSDLTDCCNIHC